MKEHNFLSFVKKETLHILRDVRTMMIVLLIPVVLMISPSFACVFLGRYFITVLPSAEYSLSPFTIPVSLVLLTKHATFTDGFKTVDTLE